MCTAMYGMVRIVKCLSKLSVTDQIYCQFYQNWSEPLMLWGVSYLIPSYDPIFFEDLLGCQFYNLQTYSWNYIIFVYIKYRCCNILQFLSLQSAPVGFTIPNAFRVTDADTGDNAITTITCFVDSANDQVSCVHTVLL